MADNISIATDEISGVQYPRVKLSVGAPDSATDMTGGAGAVGAGTPRVTLASDDPAVAALIAIRDGANTINVAQDTSVVKLGATSLTPKFKFITATASGVTKVVDAVATKKIRVLAYVVTTSAAANVKFQSHTTPTDLTSLKYLAANGGAVASFNPTGWFETVAGEQLDINLSATANVGVDIVYVEV